ncbi:MAG: glycoside hydrolase family 31 protein [Actinomycetota bacterium]
MAKQRARAAALALLMAMTSGLAPARAQTTVGWEFTASPFRLTYLAPGGDPVTAQAPGDAGPGTRMSYRLGDGSMHSLTNLVGTSSDGATTEYAVATDEPGRTASVRLTPTSRGLSVAWSLSPSDDVTAVFEALTSGPSEHFLGSGARANFVDLRGKVVPLKVGFTPSYFAGTCNQSGVPVPFFFSSAGYGIRLDTTNPGRLAFAGAADAPVIPPCHNEPDPCPIASLLPDRTQACVKASSLSYEVYAGTPAAMLDSYTAATGRPLLPPPAEFGLMKWRDAVSSSAEVLDDVTRLQSEGIPITSVLLDNPWERNGCVGSLIPDAKFDDFAAMIDAVHAAGVRFMLWVAPFVQQGCVDDVGYPDGSFVEGRSQTEVPSPFDQLPFVPVPPRDIDFTNPATLDWYKQKLRAVFALGVDGVKADRADETDFEDSTFAAGPGASIHNTYPVLFARAVADVLREFRGDDYTLMLRAGFAGSQSETYGIWAADQISSEDGLRQAIRMAQTSGASGFPIWGSDVGGYSGHVSDLALGSTPASTAKVVPSAELFIRWAQLGAVSPIFEIGGGGRHAEFWNYGPQTVALFRKFATLHYELFPYLYERARRAAATGEPILRPLGFDFPGDELAWQHDLQLMVGPDILAAPVALAGEASDTTAGGSHSAVYLPEGASWWNLYGGIEAPGGSMSIEPQPTSRFPLFIRRGAAIPFNLRNPDVWTEPWRPADLHREGRAGWLWVPGIAPTRSSATEAGVISGARDGRDLLVTLEGAPREAQVLIAGVAKPDRVVIDDVDVAGAPSGAALRSAQTGWTYTNGEFGGIVLKLAPHSGTTQIRLTLPAPDANGPA